MTFISYRNRIERQMILYIDFLPYCETREQRFKLLDEIQNIKLRVQQIDRFTMSMASQDMRHKTTKYESRNFKDS